MPLDLKKVITQLKNIESQDSKNLNEQRIDATYNVFKLACDNQERLLQRTFETNSTKKANFFFAIPNITQEKDESLDKLFECESNFSTPHITIATDGSQINPQGHEFTSACLINIGLVSIPYFQNSLPVLLSSEPTIYSSIEEIDSNSMGKGENVQEEDLISYERTLKEIEELVKLAKKYLSYNLPVIALLDGTLIHWHIEKFSEIYIEKFIKRFSDALLELKSLHIPVASFLSNSRSNDLINMLRVFKCPYEAVDCKKYCSNIDSKNFPCNPTADYKPILDRKLVERYLIKNKSKAGTRTILFKSNSKILNYYPEELKIFFFYINTGTEVARVELPCYVVNDNKLLNLIHNVTALQCKVGYGYPVTLSEAHLQAVVSKADRQIFYDLIREQILKTSQTPVKLSYKELKKRVSFV